MVVQPVGKLVTAVTGVNELGVDVDVVVFLCCLLLLLCDGRLVLCDLLTQEVALPLDVDTDGAAGARLAAKGGDASGGVVRREVLLAVHTNRFAFCVAVVVGVVLVVSPIIPPLALHQFVLVLVQVAAPIALLVADFTDHRSKLASSTGVGAVVEVANIITTPGVRQTAVSRVLIVITDLVAAFTGPLAAVLSQNSNGLAVFVRNVAGGSSSSHRVIIYRSC